MKVSIIILNRNGRKDTIECLESVFRNTYDNYEVMLVDNHSTNESLDKIRSWVNKEIEVESKYFDTTVCTHDLTLFEYSKAELDDGSYLEGKSKIDALASDKKLFLLKNDDNYGFAEGNNIAMRQVIAEGTSEYILLLNNDTVVDKDFLIELLNCTCLKKVGSLSSKNFYYDLGEIRYAGAKFNKFTGTTRHIGINSKDNRIFNNNYQTDYSVGSCVLFSIEVLDQIGLFDGRYFMYSEDLDLSIRVSKAGLENYYIGKSFIYHKVSASSKTISKKSAYYSARNRVLTVRKNYNINVYFIFLFIFLLKVLYRTFVKNTNKIDFIRGYISGASMKLIDDRF